MNRARPKAHEYLLAAAKELTPAGDDQEAWNYGWSVADYRRSPDARMSGPSGTFKLSPEGVEKFEAAVEMLLADQTIRQRWDPDELWSVIGSLLVFLSARDVSAESAASQVERLRKAKPSTVVVPVANVQWAGPPTTIANMAVFGDWDDPRFANAVSALSGEVGDDATEVVSYLAEQPHHRPMTGFATLVPFQRSRAFRQAAKQLEQLCDLALLLVQDKERYGLYALRGSWNRPGVRGLTVDRPTAQSIMLSTEQSAELGTRPLVLDELGKSSGLHWYSADPLPIQRLLENPELQRAVEQILVGRTGISSRIQLAARWFAEAFWATETDYAVLALGVSLDALIGSKSGLPGRVMSDRYALLDPNPSSRQDRARRYSETFRARSAIAHGGISTRIDEPGFVGNFQNDVTWTAWRLLQVEHAFGRELANDIDQVFDQLRWGTLIWPSLEN